MTCRVFGFSSAEGIAFTDTTVPVAGMCADVCEALEERPCLRASERKITRTRTVRLDECHESLIGECHG